VIFVCGFVDIKTAIQQLQSMQTKLVTIVTLTVTQTSAEAFVNNSADKPRIIRGQNKIIVILPDDAQLIDGILSMDLRVPGDLMKLSTLLTGLNTDRHSEILHQK